MGISQHPSKGGIPSGNTAARPSNPVIGDTYYNGQLEILEIFNGTSFVAISAPPATPSVTSVTDVGTGLAFATGGTFIVAVTPGAGGSTPSQFNVSTTAGGFSGSNATSPISLTGLTSNTSFAVVGNAQNNFGTTVNSAPSSSVLATTVPQIATIGTATASNVANEVTVTWVLPNNGGKALSAITITPFLNGTTAETSRTAATTSSTSYTFTQGQLTNNTSYTFKVKATNANGTSVDSNATNSVTSPNFIFVDYLVVAGGGGGGVLGGGGGAGGLRSTVTGTGGSGSLETPLNIAKATNYTVTIGTGGAGSSSESTRGSDGTPSVFNTITSAGGGGGGADGTAGSYDGRAGGSGGGSGNAASSGGAASPAGQGFAGGSSPSSGTGAGGGGASAIGSPNTAGPNNGGNGANGRAVSITGSSVTYAGGAGGGGRNDVNNGVRYLGGTGGTGGGGNGGSTNHSPGLITAQNGGTNLGGGGGGAGYGPSSYGPPGGTGGSGVVIIRWLTSEGTISVGAGLTADATGTDGSYSYKRFTVGSGNVSWS